MRKNKEKRERQQERERERQTVCLTDRERDGETERRRDGEMERRRDGETERERERERQRDRETHRASMRLMHKRPPTASEHKDWNSVGIYLSCVITKRLHHLVLPFSAIFHHLLQRTILRALRGVIASPWLHQKILME